MEHMEEIVKFEHPTLCIVHLESDIAKGITDTFYQVLIDTKEEGNLSPSGDFYRFNFKNDESEIHGWKRVSDIVVDEVLEEMFEYEGEYHSRTSENLKWYEGELESEYIEEVKKARSSEVDNRPEDSLGRKLGIKHG